MKPLLTGLALGLTACGELPPGESLNAEQQAIVDELMDREPAVSSMTKRLGYKVSSDWLGPEGQISGPAQLEQEIDTVSKDLQQIYAEGRFFVASGDVVGPEDEYAVAHFDESESIVLNKDMMSFWDTSIFLHEAAHMNAGHSDEIDEAMEQRHEGELTETEFTQVVKAQSDFPYFVSGLSYGPSSILLAEKMHRDILVDRADNLVESQGYDSALGQLESWLAVPDRESFLEDFGRFTEASDFLIEYGVTDEGFQEAFLESSMYEYITEGRAEAVAEFKNRHREGDEAASSQRREREGWARRR